MDTINIGVLLPASTILPVNKDFEKGLKETLKEYAGGLEFELVKEFIGQGDIKLTEKACNKLFSFDNVDLVTGILSSRAVGEIAEAFVKQQIPLLMNDLGGNVPEVTKLNDHIFINSPHLWQHAYAMGYWGVKTFGKKGMFLGAVYDAGYSFSQMFYEGMMAADPTAEWSFSVPPMPEKGKLTDMSIILPFLEQYQPDFVFGAFCGEETTLFLNEMIASGWSNKVKITGLPYLLAPFAPLQGDITVYTTLPFADKQLTADKAFYHFGRQSGEAIAIAAKTAKDRSGLQTELAKIGTLFNVGYPAPAETNIAIMQSDIKAGEANFTSQQIATMNSYGLGIENLKRLTDGVSAGWFNPYLCI
jgi:branched-chain amino acid transport system substrate-binding protein